GRALACAVPARLSCSGEIAATERRRCPGFRKPVTVTELATATEALVTRCYLIGDGNSVSVSMAGLPFRWPRPWPKFGGRDGDRRGHYDRIVAMRYKLIIE